MRNIKKTPKYFMRGEYVNSGRVHLIDNLFGIRYQLKKHMSNKRDKRGVAVWAQYAKKYEPKKEMEIQ